MVLQKRGLRYLELHNKLGEIIKEEGKEELKTNNNINNNSSNLGAEIGEKNKDKLYTSNNRTTK